jgi:catechol 2,3-dioxygenase-like lactoylglutathione lyase family enzyme
MIRVSALDHVAIPVTDMNRSIEWYQRVLGLSRRYEKEWGTDPAFLCAGESCIALLKNGKNALAPCTPTVRHFCFRLDRPSFEEAVHTLREMGIPFSEDDHQISLSLYFQDPDGHWIELTTYEPTIPGQA